MPRKLQRVVSVGALLVLVTLAYLPGLHGPFVLDDLPNIIQQPFVAIHHLDWQSLRNAAFSNDSGPLGRPIAALSFALDFYFAGQRFDPLVFKATNLVIHLLNTLLVLVLARALVDRLLGDDAPHGAALRRVLPFAGAAAWALHPIQLTSVLYVVQRMNSMAAAAVLAGLIAYVRGRERLADGRPGALSRMYGGTLVALVVGVFCKENAVLLPPFAAVVEFCAFERRGLSGSARRVLAGYYLLFVALPLGIAGSWLLAHPEVVLHAYPYRSLTLGEHVLSEARVLWLYVGLILFPRPGAFSLFHDDYDPSRGFLAPPTTLLAVLGWLAVAAVAVYRYRRGDRLVPFAVAWFLAGQLLESTVVPLRLVFEHRNYLASIGPLLVLPALVARGLEGIARDRRVRPRVLVALVLALSVAPVFATIERAYVWSSAGLLAQAQVSQHPRSVWAQQDWALYLLAQGFGEAAYLHFRAAAELAPDHVQSLFQMAKLVARRRHQLNQVEREAAGDRLPQTYRAPLRANPRYLSRLQALIEQEITRRMGGRRVPPHALSALRDLGRCAAKLHARACLALRPAAIGWAELLARRHDLGRQERANFSFEAARLLASAGEQRPALRWARRSWREAEHDPQVLALRVVLLRDLGMLDRAERVLDLLRARRGQVGVEDSQIRTLAASLRAAARAHPRSPLAHETSP